MERARIPLWLKIGWTIWVAIWAPLAGNYYGPQVYLHFCDLGNFFFARAENEDRGHDEPHHHDKACDDGSYDETLAAATAAARGRRTVGTGRLVTRRRSIPRRRSTHRTGTSRSR